MQTLRILIGCITEDLRRERATLARAIHSVRIAVPRVEIAYSGARGGLDALRQTP